MGFVLVRRRAGARGPRPRRRWARGSWRARSPTRTRATASACCWLTRRPPSSRACSTSAGRTPPTACCAIRPTTAGRPRARRRPRPAGRGRGGGVPRRAERAALRHQPPARGRHGRYRRDGAVRRAERGVDRGRRAGRSDRRALCVVVRAATRRPTACMTGPAGETSGGRWQMTAIDPAPVARAGAPTAAKWPRRAGPLCRPRPPDR